MDYHSLSSIGIEKLNDDHIDCHSCYGIIAPCNKKTGHSLQRINGASIADFCPFSFQKKLGVAFRVTGSQAKEKIEDTGKITVEKDEARSIISIRMCAQRSCTVARGYMFGSGLLVNEVQRM